MATLKLDNLLPLPLIDFSILIILNHRGVYHGYGIWQEICDRGLMSHTQLGLAHTYKTLRKLHSQGLLEDIDAFPRHTSFDERRRNYRITTIGVAVFNAEVARLETLIQNTRA